MTLCCCKLWKILFVCILLVPCTFGTETITPKIYSHLLTRKREEHKLFVKRLLISDYEKNYKLLNLAFEKIFEIIKDSKETLREANYSSKSGFPREEPLLAAVTLILENTCVSAEIILHLPELSYRILSKYDNWQEVLLWGSNFVSEFPQIVPESTFEMLSLFRQEISEIDRTDNFVNPYKSISDRKTPPNDKKKPKYIKKLKKGPQLTKIKIEL